MARRTAVIVVLLALAAAGGAAASQWQRRFRSRDAERAKADDAFATLTTGADGAGPLRRLSPAETAHFLGRCDEVAEQCGVGDVACAHKAHGCYTRIGHPAARGLAASAALICRLADASSAELAEACPKLDQGSIDLMPHAGHDRVRAARALLEDDPCTVLTPDMSEWEDYFRGRGRSPPPDTFEDAYNAYAAKPNQDIDERLMFFPGLEYSYFQIMVGQPDSPTNAPLLQRAQAAFENLDGGGRYYGFAALGGTPPIPYDTYLNYQWYAGQHDYDEETCTITFRSHYEDGRAVMFMQHLELNERAGDYAKLYVRDSETGAVIHTFSNPTHSEELDGPVTNQIPPSYFGAFGMYAPAVVFDCRRGGLQCLDGGDDYEEMDAQTSYYFQLKLHRGGDKVEFNEATGQFDFIKSGVLSTAFGYAQFPVEECAYAPKAEDIVYFPAGDEWLSLSCIPSRHGDCANAKPTHVWHGVDYWSLGNSAENPDKRSCAQDFSDFGYNFGP